MATEEAQPSGGCDHRAAGGMLANGLEHQEHLVMGSRKRRRAGQALDSRRRQLMQRSAAATLGLVGAGAAGQNAAGNGLPTPARPVRSVIYLFLTGGPSQHDTFDMKPEGPSEYKGEFQ
ncbi:MAG: DUF1501 domain-containing protein, partial [Pirellulales bacterium]|nr:DUF1501 domain-containing protein [Pirellulales bacterium]